MTDLWDIQVSNGPHTPRGGKGMLITAIVLAIVIFTLIVAHGAPVKIKWTPNPSSERVSEYRIYRNDGLAASSQDTRATVEAEPGDTLAITAWNGKESVPSDPLTIQPEPMVKVKLWRSTDLRHKTPVAEFYFPKQDAEFFGLTVETP